MNPSIPIEAKARLLRALLTRFLQENQPAPSYHFIFAIFADTEMRREAAVMRAPDWDRRRGVPSHGTAEQYVTERLKNETLYPELIAVFGSLGYDLRFQAVEQVTIYPAGTLPDMPPPLRELQPQPDDLVPSIAGPINAVMIRQAPKERSRTP